MRLEAQNTSKNDYFENGSGKLFKINSRINYLHVLALTTKSDSSTHIDHSDNDCSGCRITKGYPYRIHRNLKILDTPEASNWEGCRENCNYMGETHFTPNYCTHFVYNVSLLPLFLIRIFFLLKASDSTCTLLGLNYTRLEEGPWISGAKSCPKFCKLSTFFLKFLKFRFITNT